MQITANEMYPENSTAVEKLLTDMASLPIQKVGMCNHIQPNFCLNVEPTLSNINVCLLPEEMTAGTQFKLIITYRNGMRALFKPKR